MKNKTKIIEESYVLTTEITEDITSRANRGYKLKQNERLWFENKNGIRRPNLKFAMTKKEVDEYTKCKVSVHYFADNYCQIKRDDGSIGPMKLRDYQKEILSLYVDNPRSILNASRQVGKSVSAAICLLWFCLFSVDKGCMIVANKDKTVVEIVDKIKNIYKHLPFFLKQGVFNWNQREIAFENGCRIKTEKRTTEPAIGFTIDWLYIDEFAKIPDNIINQYYTTVVPVVSSVKNSRITITSTPDGYNLFHKLITDALRPEGDPLKNPYKGMLVYWWQVAGRRDTILKFHQKFKSLQEKRMMKSITIIHKMEEKEFSREYILEHIRGLGLDIYQDGTNYKVKFILEDEHTHIDSIRRIRVDGIPIVSLCTVTNWEEEETKLLGDVEAFKQEYGLQFITGNKLLLDSVAMESLKAGELVYDHVDIPLLSRRLTLPYTDLRFVQGHPDLFDPMRAKEYYIMAALDLGEGLGQDYTVLNLFRMIPKSREDADRDRAKFTGSHDFFKLVQIGTFRSNVYSISEFAHIFYMVMFEFFDPEKSRAVLEYNTYGGNLLSELPHVFGDHNDYSRSIFFRYRHASDDKVPKVGLKITGGDSGASKKMLVKEFQGGLRKGSLVLNEGVTISELSMFTRKDTPSGDFTFQSETGHDDAVMTCVNLSSVFILPAFKDIVNAYIDKVLGTDMRGVIEQFNKEMDPGATSLSSIVSSIRKLNRQPAPSPTGAPSPGNFGWRPAGGPGNTPWRR